jgi:demethylspheroidene O-methyltransferase
MTEPAKTGEQRLLQLLDGFMESKVLMTCLQLGVFDALAGQPLTRAELLERAQLPERAGSILIDAACALSLLEVADGVLRIPGELAPHVIKDDARFQMVRYLGDYYSEVYRDLVPMPELVRTDGASSQFKLRDYFHDDVSKVDDQVASDYSAYMDRTMAQIVEVVMESYSFAQHKRLLDLCGGPGTFSSTVLRHEPSMTGAFMEVPAVAKIGAARLAADPELAKRLQVVGGDVFKDPLPTGADVITICRSAHDWDEPRVVALFGRVFEALPRGGRVLIIERMIPEQFDASARALYLRAIYFLCKSTTACYRSAERYCAMLQQAGFSQTSVLNPPRVPYPFFRGMKIVLGEK